MTLDNFNVDIPITHAKVWKCEIF